MMSSMKVTASRCLLVCTGALFLTHDAAVASFCLVPCRQKYAHIKMAVVSSDEECSLDNLDACFEASLLVADSPKTTAESAYTLDEDEDMEALCSIDDLDACLAEGNSIEECCIDNLDACIAEAETEEAASSPGRDVDRPQFTQDSLRKFLSMPIIEVQLATLVLASSFLVGLGTLPLPVAFADASRNCELVISSVFIIEYVARWSLSGFSPKYILQPLSLIDLVAILPGLIKIVAMVGVAVPASLTGGALINLRLLRILRLQRVLVDYETFAKFEMALGLSPSNTKKYQLELARIVISIFTLLSVTAGLIYSAEHVENPAVTDYFTALYFTLITLTTVGFGDISPVTTAGRWIVGGSILVASVILPAQAAALVDALLDRDADGEQGKTKEASSLLEVNARIDGLERKMDRILALLEDKSLPSDHDQRS